MGLFSSIWSALKRPFKREPKRPQFNVAPTATLMAKVDMVGERDREMRRVAEEAIRRGHPGQAAKVYWKGVEVYLEGGHLQKAIAILQQLIRIMPEDARAYQTLGETFERLGRSSDASQAYLKLAELNARSEAFEEEYRILKRCAELDSRLPVHSRLRILLEMMPHLANEPDRERPAPAPDKRRGLTPPPERHGLAPPPAEPHGLAPPSGLPPADVSPLQSPAGIVSFGGPPTPAQNFKRSISPQMSGPLDLDLDLGHSVLGNLDSLRNAKAPSADLPAEGARDRVAELSTLALPEDEETIDPRIAEPVIPQLESDPELMTRQGELVEAIDDSTVASASEELQSVLAALEADDEESLRLGEDDDDYEDDEEEDDEAATQLDLGAAAAAAARAAQEIRMTGGSVSDYVEVLERGGTGLQDPADGPAGVPDVDTTTRTPAPGRIPGGATTIDPRGLPAAMDDEITQDGVIGDVDAGATRAYSTEDLAKLLPGSRSGSKS